MLTVLIVACNFTEEIYLNADGSGKLNIGFDGSEMMSMIPSDSARTGEVMDSTIVFKDLIREKRDSIATLSPKEREELMRLEPFSLRMQMNDAEGLMKFDMFGDFQKISQMNDAFNAFQNASTVGPTAGSKPMPKQADGSSTKVDYSFKRNTFKRTAKIVDQALFNQSVDSLASAEMFLGGSTYTFKYHFPRRIKRTNLDEATFSMDGKTLIYEANFLEMLKDPESIQIEVELED
ncbi:hypothetical protein FBT53_12775 [Flavobacterium sp. ASW18X]|nr:hypothetical protein FBT53_12775 [Flavobacterium sp. ASW18X]